MSSVWRPFVAVLLVCVGLAAATVVVLRMTSSVKTRGEPSSILADAQTKRGVLSAAPPDG